MNIGQHISNIRGILRSYSRSPESYTDQFLYEIINGARATVIKNKLRQGLKVSDLYYQRFCMQLETVNAEDCSCVPDEIACKVLRTKYKLPQVISNRNKDQLKVFLLNGKPISILSLTKWRLNKDTKELIGSFINGYIYFWNLPLNKKVVEIEALFADPSLLQDVKSCDSFGNNPTTCFSVNTSDYPVEEEYKLDIYRIALNLLSTQIPQDVTNDSNKNI